jgi:hypothetical protein
MMEEDLKQAMPEHYVIDIEDEDYLTTKVVCRCGEVFTGDDPITEMVTHMRERNES